jgi:hypothetical protein
MLRKLRGDPEIKGILSEVTKKQRDAAFGGNEGSRAPAAAETAEAAQ